MKITIIGAGNVATHLCQSLCQCGEIEQIYSRNLANATMLTASVGGSPTSSLSAIRGKADCYVISVVDDAIAEVVKALQGVNPNALWLHTSGSKSLTELAPLGHKFGVLYPLQTFTKGAKINMAEVPFFIEGNSPAVTEDIRGMAQKMSHSVYEADSARRRQMHIAAVFACNFANNLWRIADEVLAESNLPFSVLMPLLKASVAKLESMSPEQAQTGPAARGDVKIIESHASSLTGEKKDIYKLLSDSILQHYKR